MPAPYDILDVEQLVGSAFDAFCLQFGITGREAKQKVLQQIAAVAKDLKGRQV